MDLLPDGRAWALFVSAAFLLLVTPGPAVVYIVTRSLAQGTRAGLVSAAGLVVGGVFHVLAAVLGVSAILVASPKLYDGILWAGAAYLAYLGVRQLRSSGAAASVGPGAPASEWEIFREGVTVNVLNPKPALFFVALLPQFVDPTRSATAQMLFLGASFLALALVTDSAWAIAAGRAARLLGQERFRVARDRIAGVVYIGLGLAAAISGRRHG